MQASSSRPGRVVSRRSFPEIVAEEWPARAICHEIDHLDGILFIDHLSPLKRNLYKKKRKKMLETEQVS